MSASEIDDQQAANSTADVQLERSTYEIIRNRLGAQADDLKHRLESLNDARRQVFGSIETKLLATERITTSNNCVPRDIVAVGDRFLFGYNVQIGLKSETHVDDVLAVYTLRDQLFHAEPLDLIDDPGFAADFRQLYKYYRKTTFTKFFVAGPYLYFVFRVGKSASDVKAFKWLIEGDSLRYVDARSEHEVVLPSQHEFEWSRTHRDLHRHGAHPHVSIEDRIFVETVGGDLTIKVEDNTDLGEGIYAEPVDDPDQTLDDAEVFYAIVDDLILLKMRPYQEPRFRYLVFSEKVQQVTRLDSIEDACVLLPEGHGLIFSNGYYLQTGEYKTFESDITNLKFDRRIASPNGEDYLYAFYNTEQGAYVLLSYNVIEQRVDTPIVCNGYSMFDNGHLIFFKSGGEAQKHHALQIWQTPYVGDNFAPHADSDSLLFKIGNQDIVRGMAECHEIIGLTERDDSYANLYLDLVKKSGDILDSYYWLNNDETFHLGDPLAEIKAAAGAAVDEYEKVVRVRANTKQRFEAAAAHCDATIRAIQSRRFEHINDFVASLAELRQVRGELISLRDLRYIDLQAVDQLEQTVVDNTDRQSHHCVTFLLRDDALMPYEQAVEARRAQVDDLAKVADAKKLENEISESSTELEMLIDVVSNLTIEDATQRTDIIDGISAIYSQVNQARAALKKKTQELLSVEGEAEFHSQVKLLGQAVVNYLDVCDTPEKCDEYLTKLMVQVEELEGRFAEFDDFVLELSSKREEIYSAFDSKKVALVEARNKRAATLMSAAERILKGIETRVRGLESVNEIHSYFAADLMVEKVRDIIAQLQELDDSVKVDDIQSRVKTIREDAVRQLKDRNELFVDGKNVIQFGKHRFSVNVQTLDLTTVMKDGVMQFHLTGTNFLEAMDDPEFLETRDVWDQELVSEDNSVYRGEYLAYQMLLRTPPGSEARELLGLDEHGLIDRVQKFMAGRHLEGYVKGVHDHDAATLLRCLLEMRETIGMLRYTPSARALAEFAWKHPVDPELKSVRDRLEPQLKELGQIIAIFPEADGHAQFVTEVEDLLGGTAARTGLFRGSLASYAARFLLEQVGAGDVFPASERALQLCHDFLEYLRRRDAGDQFTKIAERVGDVNSATRLRAVRNWAKAYVDERGQEGDADYVDELAILLLDQDATARAVLKGADAKSIEGLIGDHPRVGKGAYSVRYVDFVERMGDFVEQVVPRFESYVKLKKELVHQKRESMRLDEFKPRILTSFVRNRLIDSVYLPLIGDNLAKQIGVVGDQKRTDLMGLLLLISPPGYGKTTLMEYVANRLGLTFMKINGPAIGHQVTSLDPVEAPNASAREEIEKLNLSLEMGDNVMIYLDDIQHCNPEFLQKFISLCDGQRRIEGVYGGNTRTYDLRGRKVAVVMAGNPYTESGEKFQIPDMLANRADTYNLGDVIGDSADAFKMSYIENALTSNPTLNALNSRSQKDVYAMMKMAERDDAEGIDLEGNYSVEEINEFVSVLRKLMRVRDVVLTVNDQYIASAAQADAYRTEPPFKLQGSYRDMNKIAERVVPIMNDEEIESLLQSHYENQAQTLTTGAEANLLKLKEMLGKLSEEDSARWAAIKKTFSRNLLLGGDGSDRMAQIIAQMSTFSDGLSDIKDALADGMTQLADQGVTGATPAVGASEEFGAAIEHLSSFNQNLESISRALSTGDVAGRSQQVQVVYKVPRVFLEVIKAQFQIMESWLDPIVDAAKERSVDAAHITKSVDAAFQRYEALIKRMEEASQK